MPSSLRNQASPREARRQGALERRRNDVLRAAAAAFAVRGFDGAQVGEIAAAAEVSLASVYTLFESKEGLYQQVCLISADAMRRDVEARVAGLPDGPERVLALVDAMFACFGENADILRIYAHATHGLPFRVREELGEAARQRLRGFGAWVTDLVRRAARGGHLPGLDPEALALSLLGAVMTAATQSIEATPPRPPGQHAAGVREVFARVLAGGAS
jgi:AcrR family transcriptional regulator